jgi:nucleoside-diphosphate-sugar epimerase
VIYILGANGFVGSAFVSYCERNKLEYKPVTRESYESLVGTECDLLINANGNSKKFLANQDPKLDFELSVQSVLKSTFDFKFQKYIHLSTCDVYANTTDVEFNSEETEIDVSKLSHYGANKYLAELLVRHYCRKWTIFRLGGMVGPNLKKNPIFDLVQGNRLFVHPNSRMQFLHTTRVAEIAMEGHERFGNEIVNLVASHPIALSNIFEMLPNRAARAHMLGTVPTDARPFTYEISARKLIAAGFGELDTESNIGRFFAEQHG